LRIVSSRKKPSRGCSRSAVCEPSSSTTRDAIRYGVRYFSTLKSSGSIPTPVGFGRVAMNSSISSCDTRSRIAKKNVSAQRTVERSTGFVNRTTAPASGDTNSVAPTAEPSRFGSGRGVKVRKLRGSSPPFTPPARNSAAQIARGAFCTSHGSRSCAFVG
jgi:hypothetical protein